MREGTFDLSSLENVVTRLGEVIVRYQNNTLDDVVRDSLIQRFEFTYSIALKTLKKYFIERAFISENINQMSFNDMIRTANELDLLKSNLEKWSKFREMRNLTSHTYDKTVAVKVVSVIPDFYEEACFLLECLKARRNGRA